MTQAVDLPTDSDPQALLLADYSDLPQNPQISVLKEFFSPEGEKTGEIRTELGADGFYIQFDCECKDALPYCQAQCCALIGTYVNFEELDALAYPVASDGHGYVMKRAADGFCVCLDRQTRLCKIYDQRPQTCKSFHCTRGADQRGWKAANHVNRQSR